MKSLTNSRSYVLLTLGFLFTLGAAVRFLPSNLAIAESPQKPSHPAESADQTPAPSSIAPGAKQVDQVCFCRLLQILPNTSREHSARN